MQKQFLQFGAACLATLFLGGCAHMSSSGSLPAVSPPDTTNKIALQLYNRLPIYANAARLSWDPIYTSNLIKPGAHSAVIPVVRKRLIALQDYSGSDSGSTFYDSGLVSGVMRFQSDHALRANGLIDQETIHALNVTPVQRYHQIVDAMNQWAQYPQDSNSRYVLVNIPEFKMMLIDQGEDKLQMKVIVGRPSRPTPTLNSKITTVVFNPHWTVPKTILAKDVIPGMRRDPGYMKKHYDMRLYDGWNKNAPEISPSTVNWASATPGTFRYRVTAPPSDVNPLGRVKFVFANSHDVYMHGTPAKNLFSLTLRDRSSGCVRLEHPMELVAYFYANNSDLSPELSAQYLSTYQTKYIQLKDPMPIHIVYIAAWTDQSGHVHFGRDIYSQG